MIAPLSNDHIDLLRSLHRLESLTLRGVSSWSAQALEWLAAEPKMTCLRDMDLGDMVTSAHSAALARFTALTSINVNLDDPAFLAHLTQLTAVTIACWSYDNPAPLVSALSHCKHLKRLTLIHPSMTSSALCALLSAMPVLAELNLWRADSLTSLSFASSVGHLALTLRVLNLLSCTSLAPEEVRHLRALTQLRSLAMADSFETPLHDDTVATMTPGSQTFDREAWPHLAKFKNSLE